MIAAAKRLFEDRGVGVPLDEVARAAGVGNATLYRHFATRAELIVAVYADEVNELTDLGRRLLGRPDPADALAAWLRAFVDHVATKRDIALAISDQPNDRRSALFARWHASMHDTAAHLLKRAQDAGAARRGLTAADLLALATGIALAGLPSARTEKLLDVIRDGYRES